MNVQTYGAAYYFSATGAVVVTSANAQIIGVLFHGTATNGCRIYAGTTATATSAGAPLGGLIRANATTGSATANPATYYPFPAYASGGITLAPLASLDVNITLFWNPAGGA